MSYEHYKQYSEYEQQELFEQPNPPAKTIADTQAEIIKLKLGRTVGRSYGKGEISRAEAYHLQDKADVELMKKIGLEDIA